MNFNLLFNDAIVHWTVGTPDGYGNYSYSDATEITGRFQKKRSMFRNDQGEEEESKAIVYTETELNVGDFIYYGALTDLSVTTDPTNITNCYEIKDVQEMKSVDGLTIAYKGIL